MTAASVVGGSPITILGSDGRQVGIPLTLLAVKDGSVDTSRLPVAVAASAAPILKALYAGHVLSTGPSSAPVLALKLKAKSPGALGNGIAVTFANVTANATAPGDSTADVTVALTDKRPGLTAASAGTELGTPAGGTRPGLVVLTAPATKLPAAVVASPLAAANPGDPLALTIPAADASGDAFVLQAAGTDDLYSGVTVAIEDVDTTAETFTLTVALDYTAAGTQIDELAPKVGTLVDVQPGPGGFAAPAAGTTHLSGGTDAQTSAAGPAEASVLSA